MALLPLLQASSDDASDISVIPPTEPRKRGRKRSNIDPAVKQELERAKDRKRCSRYRRRQRDERQKLQQEVENLTAQLTNLQKAWQVSNELATSTWKVVAHRELKERLSAEEHQRRLFDAVEARAAYIRRFQELMQLFKSGHIDQELCLPQHKKVRVDSSDAAFYRVFAEDLDSIYARTDEVLRTCGLDAVVVPKLNSKETWEGDCNTGAFLFTNHQQIPFNFDQACQTLWEAGQLPHRHLDRQDFDDVDGPENTAAFKFRVTNSLSTGKVVSAVQRVVARRYMEKGRMVLVWQSLMEGEGIFTGMRAGETGWDVLTPTTYGSKMQTCISHAPMHFDINSLRQVCLKPFTGMILESVADDGTEMMKEFEKLHSQSVSEKLDIQHIPEPNIVFSVMCPTYCHSCREISYTYAALSR
ncbi:unnamed protein product [Phytophthora fragariaefolia]|uniref:Unnamed protein product n=1 Tax=Phytophthora fragariaefolia TaxID=1490495 RepID=A0A9W6XNY5_9STRA|nr:unnamed protein product [Phytophthora fragariaefolia]